MKDDRRAFLRTVGGVSAALAGGSALGAGTDALPEAASRSGGEELQAAAFKGTSSAQNFALEIDGILVGLLRGFAGGHASAEVVLEDGGSDCVVRKQLGSVHYADLVLRLAGHPAKEVQSWINEMISCSPGARSGAILTLDLNFQEKRRLEFNNAVLTEVTLPALDSGAGKDAFVFTLRCQPDSTQKVKGSGKKVSLPVSKGKLPLASNFHIIMKGLDTTKVTRVEGLKITRPVIPAVSEGKAFSLPGKVDVGDVHMTILESAADTWSDWHQAFVIEGQNVDKGEKSATIELLAPSLKTTLFTIQLAGLGIYGLEGSSLEANSDQARKVVAHMYCEEAGFNF